MNGSSLWVNSRHFLNVRPVYWFGEWVLENLPLAVGYGITRGFAELSYRVSRDRRRRMRANVRQVLRHTRPELGEDGRERLVGSITHRIFWNKGVSYADQSLMAGGRPPSSLFRFHRRGEWSGLLRALSGGRGAILATAHLGNWNFGSFALGQAGVPVRSLLYQNHAMEKMDQKVARRAKVQQLFVGTDSFAGIEVVRALRGGALLAMPGDIPWDSRSIVAPFFGRPSRFPIGPVRIARLAEVPIFPAFCVWERPREYTAILCDPIDVRGEGEAVSKLASVFETFVASHLTLWFNFTQVWDPS
jgi:KDO2-lipid IV(A) lauroyltransferase